VWLHTAPETSSYLQWKHIRLNTCSLISWKWRDSLSNICIVLQIIRTDESTEFLARLLSIPFLGRGDLAVHLSPSFHKEKCPSLILQHPLCDFWCCLHVYRMIGVRDGHTELQSYAFLSFFLKLLRPLWSSGQSSWVPGLDSLRYQIFWKVVGLERGPLSLVKIIEELLEWKSSGSGQENRINGRMDPLLWPRDTLYPRKLALTSPTSGGRSVGIVRLRTKGHGV
jgi:hypothetical protein